MKRILKITILMCHILTFLRLSVHLFQSNHNFNRWYYKISG